MGLEIDVVVALIGAIVVATGWLVTYTLEKRREDRRRRLEQRLGQLSRQIEECYGPLFNLVHQLFLANAVQEKIVQATNAKGDSILSDDQRSQVLDFFQDEHFTILHDEIKEILKTKLHLIRAATIPQSFEDYLEHSIQERDQRLLWKQHQINTGFITGVEWPEEFYDDIRRDLLLAMREYDAVLAGLRENHKLTGHVAVPSK